MRPAPAGSPSSSPVRSRGGWISGAGSTFAAPQGVQPIQVTPEERHVLQGSLERSNVRSVIEMTRMIEVTRAYSSVATMLQNQGEMRKSAVEIHLRG